MRGVENIYIPAEHTPAKVISVLEPKGAKVNYDTKIILYESANPRYSYEDTESDQDPEPEFLRHFLKAQFEGTLKDILVIEGDEISSKEMVAYIEVECTHETLFGGMCVDCGKNLHLSSNKIELERASIKFDHSTNDITTTKKNAEMLDLRDANRLLKARKLTLIIDLDQTIIHASLNTKIAEWMSDPENINYPATHDIGKFTLNDSPSIYYIKPRPFLKRFLEELNPLYEFHIYTMGVRSYALEVVKIIDPEGKYFRERIITRDENLSSTKSISRLFPTDQSMVVAIDDRPDVWEWSPNLIRVVPFEFFPGTGDINASHLPEIKKDDTSSIVPGTESTSETKDEEDTNSDSNNQNGTDDAKETNGEVSDKKEGESGESQAAKPTTTGQVQNGHVAQLTEDDKELVLTLKQLKRLHELFYRYQDSPDLQRADNLQPTVPKLLPYMKSEVLKGVYITFSGIIPIDANPRKQDAWIWAESFGAVCSTDITSKTTHLVATKQTHKVNQALRMSNVKVVHSKWLYDSVTQWEKKNEANYPIPDVDMNQYTNSATIPIIVDPSEAVDAEKSDAEPNIDEDQFHDYLEKWNNEHPSLDDPEIKELFGESFTDIDTDDDFSDANSDYASPTNPDENTHLHPSSAALKQPRSPSLRPPEVAKRRKRKNLKQPNQYLRQKIINRMSQEESDVSDYENGSPSTSSFNIDSPYNDNAASRTPDIHFASDDETPSGASSPSISPNNQPSNENDYMDQDENLSEEGFKDLFQEGLAVLDSDYSDGTNNDMDFDDDTLQSPNEGHQNELNTQQSIHDSGTD